MICDICGKEMREMGEWPVNNMTAVADRWHCVACNTYVKGPIKYELVPTSNDEYARKET